VQPEQQGWGQAPVQPEQQGWGQAPVQPEQQAWGQAPVQPEQSEQQGGWQSQQPGAWGSAVPPAPVPQGLTPGSPMGQTNVFPTSETIDPITGMPVAPAEGKSKTSGKRLVAIVGATLLVGLLVLFLVWWFVIRSSADGAGATTGPVEVTATISGPVDPSCSDLGAALTADDLSSTVVQRLNDVAVAMDLEENQAYFEQLAKDIKPIMGQYKSACVAAVSAGNAPEFYRVFVETFESSVADGATVAASVLESGGQVPAADAERLRGEAAKLQASADAVITVAGGTPSPSASTQTGSVTPSATASPSSSPTTSAPGGIAPSPIG
ncbi:MAG TPA: hypothetical protein PLT68_10090, partial [Actinomycetota bacterium]|nr:hypothetical protein [Actinomycetota bacterium]